MPKSIEDIKGEIQDKLNSKIRERDNLIIKLDNIQKDLMTLVNQQYELDLTKTKIKCVGCRGAGYVSADDNKKKICPTCGGMKYNWAEVYEDESDVKN